MRGAIPLDLLTARAAASAPACDHPDGPPDAGWKTIRAAWFGGVAIDSPMVAGNSRPETIAWAMECS